MTDGRAPRHTGLSTVLVALVVLTLVTVGILAVTVKDPLHRLSGGLPRGTTTTTRSATTTVEVTTTSPRARVVRTPLAPTTPETPSSYWTARTPDEACRSILSRPGAVLVIGDSLTVGGAAQLEAALAEKGFPVCIDARSGRNAEEGNVALRRVMDEMQPAPDTLVVMAFGANDADRGEHWGTCQSSTALSLVGDRRMLWVNGWNGTSPESRSGAERFNAEITAAASEIERLRVVDWHSEVVVHPEALRHDRVHPTELGRKRWVDLLVGAIVTTDEWSPTAQPVVPDCEGATTTWTPTEGTAVEETDGTIHLSTEAPTATTTS